MNSDTAVLIVGAGGIGCELVKNAVLAGLCRIHLVDLDTIELSNLNRQFLFRRRHIGQAKALVAREAVLPIAPDCDIVAHVADITDIVQFPISFFASFRLVLNALDNVAARRHVNNMCLAANVPLIESGTAGHLGQTAIIINGRTECFDCVEKDPPKTFPVCTIRSTPSTPLHCIVWAKDLLFPNLFGQPVDNSSIPSDTENSELLKDVWHEEQRAYDQLRQLHASPDQDALFHALFNKCFIEDVVRLRRMDDLWKTRVPPSPLDPALVDGEHDVSTGDIDALNDHELWPLSVWIALLRSSMRRLRQRVRPADHFIEQFFDKDDQDTLDFVAAAANLRAAVFAIPATSRFRIKAMAGNIIPAVATTNAIAASMILVHAANILNGRNDNYCNVYINHGGERRSPLTAEASCPPNPKCPTCAVDRGLLTVNCAEFPLASVLHAVLPEYLVALRRQFPETGREEIDLQDVILIEGSRLIYDGEEDTETAAKSLSALSISDSKFIRVEIDGQRPLLLGIVDDATKQLGDFTTSFTLLPPLVAKDESSDEEDTAAGMEKDDIEMIGTAGEAEVIDLECQAEVTDITNDADAIDVSDAEMVGPDTKRARQS